MCNNYESSLEQAATRADSHIWGACIFGEHTSHSSEKEERKMKFKLELDPVLCRDESRLARLM